MKATEGIVYSFQSCEPPFLISAFFRTQLDTKKSRKDQLLMKSSQKPKSLHWLRAKGHKVSNYGVNWKGWRQQKQKCVVGEQIHVSMSDLTKLILASFMALKRPLLHRFFLTLSQKCFPYSTKTCQLTSVQIMISNKIISFARWRLLPFLFFFFLILWKSEYSLNSCTKASVHQDWSWSYILFIGGAVSSVAVETHAWVTVPLA